MLRVRDSTELQAATLAFKRAGRDLRKRLNTESRRVMNPVWRDEIDSRLANNLDRAVFRTGARIKAGNPPAFIAASSKRTLSGGLTPAHDWAPVEFGTANRSKRTTYKRRSPKGGTHTVTRRTTRQLYRRVPSGRVAYKAARELAPRLASLWVHIIVKIYSEAANGKQV